MELRKRVKEVIAWVLVAGVAAMMFYGSAHTGQSLRSTDNVMGIIGTWLYGIQDAIFGPDSQVINTTAHFLEYTLLGLVLYNALRFRMEPDAALPVMVVLLASLYGVSDEIHQYFVPNRACDPVDWFVDTAGATLGAVGGIVICTCKTKRDPLQ